MACSTLASIAMNTLRWQLKSDRFRRIRSALPLRTTARAGAICSLICIGLSACATRPESVAEVPTQHSVVYTYLMAHGMARGYVMSEPLDRPSLDKLISIDHAALMAVATESALPSSVHLRDATHAVENLLAMLAPNPVLAPTATVARQ